MCYWSHLLLQFGPSIMFELFHFVFDLDCISCQCALYWPFTLYYCFCFSEDEFKDVWYVYEAYPSSQSDHFFDEIPIWTNTNQDDRDDAKEQRPPRKAEANTREYSIWFMTVLSWCGIELVPND